MSFATEQPEVLADLLRRMRRIEGQARGVQRMLEEGADCDAILTQLSAMRSALHRVGLKVLGCHLSSKMIDEVRRGGSGLDAVEEALESFMRLG